MRRLIEKGRQVLENPQMSILSAAVVIMLMIIASRVLGLVRQRVLAVFFTASDLSLFFAAFRLPDLIFEVLVFGTFSSAFIPVFTKLAKKDRQDAWKLAATITNLGLVIFALAAVLVGLLADPLYRLFAPGFDMAQRRQIVALTKILFTAQGFFIVSYVLTGVLESLRRFLVPALAPVFYNLGIILGTLLFSRQFGLMAPVIGVFAGAVMHFCVQLPLAYKLGFRFRWGFSADDEVKKIGRLALPRVIEVSFLQVAKMVELYFASLLSIASYAYYTFGNTLQLLPVGLFGTSIAKAALPNLTRLSDTKEEFARVLFKSLFEMTFLIIPVTVLMVVLRIPIVRLVYGTDIFTWESTVQTSMVVSAFAFGITFQAAAALLARAFYALHDTKTPVGVSMICILITIVLDFIFIRGFAWPVWGLAAAFSVGSAFQAGALFVLINQRINGGFKLRSLVPLFKHCLSALFSGTVMFFLLKFFDQSVWVKRLSFLGAIEATKNIAFQRFVLDTRYTVNLIVLVIAVALVGMAVYLVTSVVLKTRELATYFNLLKRIFNRKAPAPVVVGTQDMLTPPPVEELD